jgi:hypothetical protein
MEEYLSTGYRGNGEEVKRKYHIYPEQAAAGLWTNPTDLQNILLKRSYHYRENQTKCFHRK